MAKDSKNWESPLEKTLKQQQELARRIMDGRLLDDFKDLQEKINKPYKDIQTTIRKINQPYKDLQVGLTKSLGNVAMGQLGLAALSHTQNLTINTAMGNISKQNSLQALAESAKGSNIALTQWERSFAVDLSSRFSTGSASQKIAESLERSDIEFRKSIDKIINGSLTNSLPSAISSAIGLQPLAGQQALNMLNVTGSIGSVAASIASENRSLADLLPRFSAGSAFREAAESFEKSAIESRRSILKSYQPIFTKQEEWQESLFSAVQRPTTQTEKIFYKALTNDTDLESDFIPLKSNEYRKDLFTPESPSRQPQLLVPQAVESSDDACFDPVFWNILTQVEQYLRSTIEKCLTELSGSRWIKQRVPCDMRRRWEQRQEEERSAGRPIYNLIQYADFMDLVSIIIRSDNWKDAFKSIFKNKNEIQISLERLHPIRKSIAHSRPLTKFDILTLANEASRIFRALGLSFSLELSIIRFHLR